MAMRGIKAALAILLAAASGTAFAQDFPARHITLIVPYAAGGPTDINARMLAPALGQALGVQVVVDNRGGAGTTIGTGAVAKAEPDGYTLLFADIAFAVSPGLVANLTYDPAKDFTAIGFATRSSMALVVNPDVPAKSVAELVAMAKAKPGELKYASAGTGSPPHLGGLAFARAAGLSLLHVPYRGAGPAVNDVVAGHVSLMFLGPSASANQVKAGKLRALAVTGAQRIAPLPDVPTFRELGLDLAGIDSGTWWGLMAPAKTPPGVIDKLNRALNQAINDPDTRKKYEAADFTVVGGKPEDFARFVAAQQATWREALTAAGVKPE